MNADGSGAAVLAASARDDAQADWSPDGSRIAFTRCARFPCTSIDGADDPMIVVVNADGTAGVAVANGVDPSWSREGHIAFNSEECGPVDFFVFCFYEGIRILLADGTLSELVGTGVNPAWRR